MHHQPTEIPHGPHLPMGHTPPHGPPCKGHGMPCPVSGLQPQAPSPSCGGHPISGPYCLCGCYTRSSSLPNPPPSLPPSLPNPPPSLPPCLPASKDDQSQAGGRGTSAASSSSLPHSVLLRWTIALCNVYPGVPLQGFPQTEETINNDKPGVALLPRRAVSGPGTPDCVSSLPPSLTHSTPPPPCPSACTHVPP